jgi:hypothetical protein
MNGNYFYMAMMPGVFGYGITCFSLESSTDALLQVKQAYKEGLEARGVLFADAQFMERFEYFGGRVEHMMWNKVYDENLSS